MHALRRAGRLALAALVLGACSGASAPSAAPASSAVVRASPSAQPTPAPATPSPSPRWDQLPTIANDPAALGEQLAMAERMIRDPQVTGEQLVWAGHLQQLDYSRLADFPDWRDQVLAALPANVRPAVLGSLEAGKALRAMNVPIPKSLPNWTILQPKPPEELLGYYREGEAKYAVPWYYLAALHLVESRMGRIRGDSSAGAQGPMQFIPSTWDAYGQGDINSDHDSIIAAARYLAASGAPGNMPRALFAYNNDTRYVASITAYAEVMKNDPAAYRGYYGWQVYFPTKDGPILLPVGWKKE